MSLRDDVARHKAIQESKRQEAILNRNLHQPIHYKSQELVVLPEMLKIYQRHTLLQTACHKLALEFSLIITGNKARLTTKIPQTVQVVRESLNLGIDYTVTEYTTRNVTYEDLAVFYIAPMKGTFHIWASSSFQHIHFVYHRYYGGTADIHGSIVQLAQIEVNDTFPEENIRQLFIDAAMNEAVLRVIKKDISFLAKLFSKFRL